MGATAVYSRPPSAAVGRTSQAFAGQDCERPIARVAGDGDIPTGCRRFGSPPAPPVERAPRWMAAAGGPAGANRASVAALPVGPTAERPSRQTGFRRAPWSGPDQILCTRSETSPRRSGATRTCAAAKRPLSTRVATGRIMRCSPATASRSTWCGAHSGAVPGLRICLATHSRSAALHPGLPLRRPLRGLKIGRVRNYSSAGGALGLPSGPRCRAASRTNLMLGVVM